MRPSLYMVSNTGMVVESDFQHIEIVNISFQILDPRPGTIFAAQLGTELSLW